MRTNKIIQYLFITSIIFVSMGVSFGETIDIENIIGAQTISGYKQITIPLLKQTSKLSYIDTRFCNDGIKPEKLTENLSMMIRPGEKKEICMIHFNNYEEDIDMFGTFPESQIYPNGSQDCSTNNTRDNPFSKFIKPFKEELISVPAKGYIIRKTTIKFPIGIKGLQKGCFAYSANPGKVVEGEMFSIVTRKVHYIDILVQGDEKIDSKINISNITSKVDENKKLGIEFNIENNGSVDEAIEINGEFSSIFGFKKDFSITGIIIGTNNKKTLNIKDFGVDIELPRYKGPFTLNLTINHKPYFGFDISNSGMDPKILEGGLFEQTKTIFIFPTLPIIGLLVFILLVYLAFFRKPKVIIQQVTVPTPTAPTPQ